MGMTVSETRLAVETLLGRSLETGEPEAIDKLAKLGKPVEDIARILSGTARKEGDPDRVNRYEGAGQSGVRAIP